MFFGNPILFAYQLAACMAAIGITTCGTLVILLVLKYTIGLRYSAEDEEEGVDFVAHKQVAYRYHTHSFTQRTLRLTRALTQTLIHSLNHALTLSHIE